jgi:hypothetical protein
MSWFSQDDKYLLILKKLDDLHKEHGIIIGMLSGGQKEKPRFDYEVGPVTNKQKKKGK